MDYFRAVARVNEKSKRVFELTAHIIDMNPAHYTIWYVIWNDQPKIQYASHSYVFPQAIPTELIRCVEDGFEHRARLH